MSDDLVKRLRPTLGNVSVEEHMHGDNLAIVLCSFYEDAEGETDGNGWTEAATIGCDKTLDAIHAHYSDVIEALTAEADAWRNAYQALEDITTSGGMRHTTEDQDRRLQTARKDIRALSRKATP